MVDAASTLLESFLAGADGPRRADLIRLDAMIRRIAPQLEPALRGKTLAYGRYRLICESGREEEWYRLGISKLKHGLSFHVCAEDAGGPLVQQVKDRLGKADVGKSCIRFRNLDDLDLEVVEQLIKRTAELCWN